MSSEAADTPNGPEIGTEPAAKKSRKRSLAKGSRAPRKRTKTGCLTCRKRRIKCGEERPTCFNCQKSRRECEGYRPPIVFRRSTVNLTQTPISPAPDSFWAANGMFYPGYNSHYPSPSHDDPNMASAVASWHGTNPGSSEPPQAMSAAFFNPMRSTSMPSINTQLAFETFNSPENIHSSIPPFSAGSHWPNPLSTRSDGTFSAQEQNSNSHVEGLGVTVSQEELLSFLTRGATGVPLSNLSTYRDPAQSSYNVAQVAGSTAPPFSMSAQSNEDVTSFPFLYSGGNRGQSEASNLGASHVSIPLNDPSNQARSSFTHVPHARQPKFESSEQNFRSAFGFPGPSQILDAAAVINQDDDYWDLPTDDDEDEEEQSVEDKVLFEKASLERDFDTITALTKTSLALAIFNLSGASAYTYPGFSLDEYRPEHTASPLRNPYTQRVFAHFVFSTGPLISYLQQRQRVAPSSNASIGKVASSHQGLWTYTLATMALHNQGLLHAMLAMASLHMAKLQGASSTPSLKHYSYALRRIHRDVQHNRKRHEVSTLAATLLLAFFEIGQADHRKWSTHLVGAKQLISEIDFASMMAQIRYVKAVRALEFGKSISRPELPASQPESGFGEGQTWNATVEELFPNLDHGLLNKINGKRCKGNAAQDATIENIQPFTFSETLTAAELRNFQILQDLFWWNCRHDIIHGLVGGNALLLDFDKWSDCPPRAPAGQPDAVHGTFDHFILLMGRLVRFISQDRSRKIWASATSSASGSPPGPGFYGMAPSHGPGPIPRAYQRPGPGGILTEQQIPTSPEHTIQPATELEAAMALALDEWNDIYTAFTALADSLGAGFQPLTDEEHEPVNTPFGSAVLFKSHAIAALWAWYYAGLIIAVRSHPSMPAAQTIACGAASSKTEKYANMVGRITYCITSDFLTPPLDPSSAGAFAESSLPLFFAGVQYRDPDQRRWTIAHLREIESLTGWATIGLCANGCESAWVKAYEMGAGPEYIKSTGIYQGQGTVVVMEEDQEQMLKDAIEAGGKSSKYEEPEIFGERMPRKPDKLDSKFLSRQQAEKTLMEHERRFTPFYRGTQVMWAYQLYSTTLRDDFDGMSVESVGSTSR